MTDKGIMGKILGLDLGTNSIGWAVVERKADDSYSLLHKGVHIFQEGVVTEKGTERPAVQDRTNARASRRHYFRRRLRKIELLKILVREGLCPPLSDEELSLWRKEKKYPMNEEFLSWQRTNDNDDRSPYHDRFVCLNQELDLSLREHRYMLGRALYHLAQRRGFLSCRKDAGGDEDESGKVKSEISSLSMEMKQAGCRYLGEYFYKCYGKEKIRTRYTARVEHYLAEFNAICEKQGLSEGLVRELKRAIFFQRPLKSQKGLVGKCPFEPKKARCQVSHPRFEEYRMLCFVNSIRVSYLGGEFVPLDEGQRAVAMQKFYRKTDFRFEDIEKALAGKGNYAFRDDRKETAYKFNYREDYPLSGCPVTTSIMNALGLKAEAFREWEPALCERYTLCGRGGSIKSADDIIDDVWHALVDFDDEKALAAWLVKALQLEGEVAAELAKLHVPQGYASLSLKAIRKILPFLREGRVYSDAVFLANLPAVIDSGNLPEKKIKDVVENLSVVLADDTKKEVAKYKEIRDYLLSAVPDCKPDKLYHPSMIEVYPKALPDEEGRFRLGSPRTDAFRNPMAMRALFRLRALVNCLLEDGKIDRDTQINIEFARGLNDANMRRAIERYQRNREKVRSNDRERLAELIFEQTGKRIEPTETDLLKYRLWEEQGHVCLYTGKQIGVTQFVGENASFDIEHTVPRSVGGDDSMMNKTLCDARFNREVKKAQLPSALASHEEILQRIADWEKTVEDLRAGIARQRRFSKSASTKAQKDAAIQKGHLLRMEYDYWKGKVERFKMLTVPEGFSNRQGVDIGLIGKYARLYLKTVFDRTYIVKGATTADFRKAWGLQDSYEKKNRNNHCHHCIDAITIACINKKEYDDWKYFQERADRYRYGGGSRPVLSKPWPTFTEDVLSVPDSVLVTHYTADNMWKKSRKKVRVRGVVKKGLDGQPQYACGSGVRGLLHKDTFYGTIMAGDKLRHVIRKPLADIKDTDVENIVDGAVRQKVKDAVVEHGSLKKAVEAGVWMNREKNVPIKKVRMFTSASIKPFALKGQRDLSEKEYKQNYLVVNDGNYCVAYYGDEKPSFKVFSRQDVAIHLRQFGTKTNLVPPFDESGRPVMFVIKPGTMVLFYENTREEVYKATQKELRERLYKVTGISDKGKYVYLTLRFHQESSLGTELKSTTGLWKKNSSYRPLIDQLSQNQCKFLVQGVDFDFSISGEVVFN